MSVIVTKQINNDSCTLNFFKEQYGINNMLTFITYHTETINE